MPSAPEASRQPEPIVQRLFVLVLALGAILWVAVVVWQSALQTGLAQLGERGRADLRLASDRLVSSMLSFREAAVMTADHPFVVALAQSGEGGDPSAVAQVLRRYERTGGLSTTRGAGALRDLEDLAIERYPHRPLLPRVWELRANLTAYDAVYVALAEALEATLLTGDARLARAPHRARVELLDAG